MKEQMQAEFRAYERIISHLKKVLADTHIGTAKIRRIWMEARVCGPATFPRAADRLHERQGKQQKPVCVYLCSTRRNCFSERLLRCYKRKQAQAVSFRSFESLEDLCDCMSMLFLMRKMAKQIFSTEYPRCSDKMGKPRWLSTASV